MPHEQFEEAAALSVMDALDREEAHALASHIGAGCQECRVALMEYKATANLLPYALPPEPAPFDLQSHLIRTFELDFAKTADGVVQEPHRTAKRMPRWNWNLLFGPRAIALASVVLLILVGGYAIMLQSKLEAEVAQRREIETAMHDDARRLSELQAQAAQQEDKLKAIRTALADQLGSTRDTLAAREGELADLRELLAQQERPRGSGKTSVPDDGMDRFLRAPNIKVVSLSGSDDAKSAGGLLFYDPSRRKAFLYAFNMPPLPQDKTYQLWAILDRPISAGTFRTDRGNKSRVMMARVPSLDQIKQFAVSVEPHGGSSEPDRTDLPLRESLGS